MYYPKAGFKTFKDIITWLMPEKYLQGVYFLRGVV